MCSTKTSYICSQCNETFDEECILENSDGVCYCVDCFRDYFSKPSGDDNDNPEFQEKMFPYPEIFTASNLTLDNRRSSDSTISISTRMTSLRPVQCPKVNCNKYVSVFSLESHFKCEHAEVPTILTKLDARSTLNFYTRDIKPGTIHCIVLINVMHDFSDILPQMSTSSTTSLRINCMKPVMILLASRISGNQLVESLDDTNYSCDSASNSQCSGSFKAFSTSMDVDNETMKPEDQLIIWMASNVKINLSYTIAVSTLNNKIRQKFFGTIKSLEDDPIEICREGICLTLFNFQVNGMTEKGTKPLTFDIVIHSSD